MCEIKIHSKEVRTTLQQALEAIGLSLPPLNEHGCQDLHERCQAAKHNHFIVDLLFSVISVTGVPVKTT